MIRYAFLFFFKTVNESWNALATPSDKLFFWNSKSTYIKSPPFFENLVWLFIFNKMNSLKDFFPNHIYFITPYSCFDYPFY